MDIVDASITTSQVAFRTSVFEEVYFDPCFCRFSEFYDFGMQWKREKIRDYATRQTTREHDTSVYAQSKMRARDRKFVRERFMAKWDVEPFGPSSSDLR